MFRKFRGREVVRILPCESICTWKVGSGFGAYCVRAGYMEGSLDGGRPRTGHEELQEEVGRIAWAEETLGEGACEMPSCRRGV